MPVEMREETSQSGADLYRLAGDRAFTALDDAWQNALGQISEVGTEPFLRTAEILAAQNENDRAATLLGLLVEPLKNAGRTAEALGVLRRAAELSSNAESMRDEIAATVRATFRDRPGIEAYLKKAGIIETPKPMREALKLLDQFLDFPSGRHVFHAAGWGVGRVVRVDDRSGDLTVDFERKPGHVFPVDSAVKFVERLSAESLMARCFSDLEALKQLAVDDPAELIRIAVRSRGNAAKSDQVKKDLLSKVVASDQWSKFWTRAKKVLTHDPFVEITEGARPLITIRVGALRFADEVLQILAKSNYLADAIDAAQRLQKEAERQPDAITDDERVRVAGALAQRLKKDGATLAATRPGTVVTGIFVIQDLMKGQEVRLDDKLQELLTDLSKLSEVARELRDVAFLKRYVAGLRAKHGPACLDRFAEAFTQSSKDFFQHMLATLKEDAPQGLVKAILKITNAPDPNVDTLFDLARESFLGRLDAIQGAPDKLRIFERLLAFADKVERQRTGGSADAPAVRARIKHLLGAKNHDIVRKYFTDAAVETLPHTYKRIMDSQAIGDEVREAARGVVARLHSHILSGRPAFFWEEEGVVYMTRKGISALQSELEEVTNRRLPENFRAIGAAAAHGDLSENAEYTAALEERDKLVARADRLQKELQQAKALEEADRRSDVVGPGTRVQLTNTTSGAAEDYIILGPWDGDIERGIMSYTAPLAKGLLGRARGEEAEIVLPGGGKKTYKVLSIALANLS